MKYLSGDITRLKSPKHNDPWVEVRTRTLAGEWVVGYIVIIDLTCQSPHIINKDDIKFYNGALKDQDVGKHFWTTHGSGKFLFPFAIRDGKMIHFKEEI